MFKFIAVGFLLLFSAVFSLAEENLRYTVYVPFSSAQTIYENTLGSHSISSVAYACLVTGSDAVYDTHTHTVSYVTAHTGPAWVAQQNAEYYDSVYFYILAITGDEAFATMLAGMFVPWDQLIGIINEYMDVE